MPRRRGPDPIAKAVGHRIRELREEAGLTLEKLAYESDLGSKGYLSDIEKGLARPTLTTLKVIADHLGVLLLDLVTFPADDERQRLVDLARRAPVAAMTKAVASLEAEIRSGAAAAPAQKVTTPRRTRRPRSAPR